MLSRKHPHPGPTPRSARRAAGAVRRALAAFALTVPLVACGGQDGAPATAGPSSPPTVVTSSPVAATTSVTRELRALERKYDATVGLYAVDTGTGREIAHRAGERFGYHSTFKALAAGAVLRKFSPHGMDRVIKYTEEDLVTYSPVTEKHVGTGMTLSALCDAAVRHSDNTAGNLLLKVLGGPKGLQKELRRLGDDVTRMNRAEPDLGDWRPGETRDTSTPRALARDLRAYVLGDTLGKPERTRLTTWLRTNVTGDHVIRAGVPKDWTVADKTGTGSHHGARNDIAVVWPPDEPPIVLAILTHRAAPDATPEDSLLAEAASVVVAALT